MAGYPDYEPPQDAADPAVIADAVNDYLTANPPGIPDHNDTTLRDATGAHPATSITVDASGFDGNLTTADDTVQEVAQKLDDLVIPAAYTDEQARDAVGSALTAGSGISVTVDDPGNTITVASTITQYTDEMARDALGAALVAGANVTITPNDGADTITIAATGGGGDLTHIASVGNQTQITEAATGFATSGTNATVLDSAITLPACAAGDVIQFVAGITYTNSSGASRAPRPGFRLGSTNVTIGSIVPTGNVSSGVTCSWIVRGTIHVLTTTSQELIVEVLGDGTSTSNQGARTAATVDMSGTSSLQITFGTSNASGTQTAQLLAAHVTKVTA